jgi:hypothetical protein
MEEGFKEGKEVRKRHESQSDLENERKASEFLSKCWNFKIKKLPDSYRADFLAEDSDGKFQAVIEFKRRYFKHGDFPDVFMSVQKYLSARDLAVFLDVPFIFAVWLDDGVYHAKIFKDYKVTFSGRTKNARDDADIEPVVHIPMDDFIKTKKR